MTQPFNAILVGTAIGTMSQAAFARRLRQMERLSATRLVAVVPKGLVKTTTEAGLFDRVAVRSFVPETFLKQFEHFLRPAGVLAKVAAAIPGFRSQTISSVEQVFGMMLGTEVNILPAPPPTPADGLSVAVPLSLAEQHTEMVVSAIVSQKTGLELAARMSQQPPAERQRCGEQLARRDSQHGGRPRAAGPEATMASMHRSAFRSPARWSNPIAMRSCSSSVSSRSPANCRSSRSASPSRRHLRLTGAWQPGSGPYRRGLGLGD